VLMFLLWSSILLVGVVVNFLFNMFLQTILFIKFLRFSTLFCISFLYLLSSISPSLGCVCVCVCLFMWHRDFGGWVAPRIYYMGYCSVVRFSNIRIGGVSGIYKDYAYHFGRVCPSLFCFFFRLALMMSLSRLLFCCRCFLVCDFVAGHWETPPYDKESLRSVYHVREFEIFKMLQITNPIDIIVSHDWPRGIWNHGDKEELLRKKGFLRDEVVLGLFLQVVDYIIAVYAFCCL